MHQQIYAEMGSVWPQILHHISGARTFGRIFALPICAGDSGYLLVLRTFSAEVMGPSLQWMFQQWSQRSLQLCHVCLHAFCLYHHSSLFILDTGDKDVPTWRGRDVPGWKMTCCADEGVGFHTCHRWFHTSVWLLVGCPAMMYHPCYSMLFMVFRWCWDGVHCS